jgi:hypothetical protein
MIFFLFYFLTVLLVHINFTMWATHCEISTHSFYALWSYSRALITLSTPHCAFSFFLKLFKICFHYKFFIYANNVLWSYSSHALSFPTLPLSSQCCTIYIHSHFFSLAITHHMGENMLHLPLRVLTYFM